MNSWRTIKKQTSHTAAKNQSNNDNLHATTASAVNFQLTAEKKQNSNTSNHAKVAQNPAHVYNITSHARFPAMCGNSGERQIIPAICTMRQRVDLYTKADWAVVFKTL